MRIFAGVLPVSTILAFAVLITTAAGAQSEHDSDSCVDVKPPALDPANTLDGVPIYIIPEGASGHRAICRATEALAEGMVDLELRGDRVLAHALGDPTPDRVTGEVSDFPYTEPGSQPTPGLPPPGPSPEHTDHSHAYAAFVDPATGVEYTFSTVAENLADAEEASVDWITSTVKPLLENHLASKASALATANAKFAAAPAIGTPSFDTRAWNLLLVKELRMPNNRPASGTAAGRFDRILGSSGAVVRVYRLNAGGPDDYFLVDTAYTQTPSYDPFTFGFASAVRGEFWMNGPTTQYTLTAKDPFPSSTITPRLYDFAPQTKVTSSTQTFSVGANLMGVKGGDGSGGGVSASYSVTRTQESVETSANATLGADIPVKWTDQYNGFRDVAVPNSTLTHTFTGERLAIFRVPATINNNVPAGRYAGFSLAAHIYSEVRGYVYDPFSFVPLPTTYAEWNITDAFFVHEPQFSATPTEITVSKSQNNVNNAVIVKVVAELPGGNQQVTWRPQLQNSGLETDVLDGHTGNGQFEIYPTATAVAGSTTILLNTVPPAAANSVRNGPLKIKVTIVP